MKKLQLDNMEYKVETPQVTYDAELIDWMAENLSGYYKMATAYGYKEIDDFHNDDNEQRLWYNECKKITSFLRRLDNIYMYAQPLIKFELEEDAVAFKLRWIEK